MLTTEERQAIAQGLTHKYSLNGLIDYLLDLANRNTDVSHELLLKFSTSTPEPVLDSQWLSGVAFDLTHDLGASDDPYDFDDSEPFDIDEIFDDLQTYTKNLEILDSATLLDDTLSLILIRQELADQSMLTDFITKPINQVLNHLQQLPENELRQADQLILKKIRRLADHYDFQYTVRLLRSLIPVFLPEFTPQILADAQNDIDSRHDKYTYDGAENEAELLKYTLLINQNKLEEARTFAESHFDNYEIQTKYLKLIQSQNDIATLERLVSRAKISEWRDTLLRWYREHNDYDKLVAALKQQLFDTYSLETFKELRSVYIQLGSWQTERPFLLDELTASHANGYAAEILQVEHDLPNLLKVVSRDPELIKDYGVTAYPADPAKVTQLFKQVIDQRVASSSKRPDYDNIARLLNTFSQTGEVAKAIQWRQSIMKQYPNRPAMADELNKIRF